MLVLVADYTSLLVDKEAWLDESSNLVRMDFFALVLVRKDSGELEWVDS